MEVMTLDEAIQHAEEVADKKDKEARNWEDYDMNVSDTIAECRRCAAEYRQLAEWLKDYKRLLEQEKWIPVSKQLPESDGYYRVIEKNGNVGTFVFHKEGNSEEYWKRCAIAWMSLLEKYKAESE